MGAQRSFTADATDSRKSTEILQMWTCGLVDFSRCRRKQRGFAHFSTQTPICPLTSSILLPSPPPSSLLPSPFTLHPSPSSISFTLNRQFRTWPFSYSWTDDTLRVKCKETTYCIPRRVVDNAVNFCWLSPQTDGTVYPDVPGTFAFISRQAYTQLSQTGSFVYDSITWRLLDETADELHVQADIDGTEMWIARDADLPLVIRMQNNPLGIDWQINKN